MSMDSSIAEKLSQSLDALIRKPAAAGRGRGSAPSGRGTPSTAGRGHSHGLAGRSTSSRQPIPTPLQSSFELKRLQKVNQLAPPCQHNQLLGQKPQKRPIHADEPSENLPLAQKLGLSLADLAKSNTKKPYIGGDATQQQYSTHQTGIRSQANGRGSTSRGRAALGPGQAGWSSTAHGAATRRGGATFGSTSATQPKHILVNSGSSARGRGRSRGRGPGRGYIPTDRRINGGHAPIHHSLTLDEESYEDNDRGYDEDEGDGEGAGEQENGDDDGNDEGEINADVGVQTTAAPSGTQPRRHVTSEQALAYRKPASFRSRLADMVREAQRSKEPLPLPTQFRSGSRSEDADKTRAKRLALDLSAAELRRKATLLAADADSKEAQVNEAKKLLGQVAKLYKELTAGQDAVASASTPPRDAAIPIETHHRHHHTTQQQQNRAVHPVHAPSHQQQQQLDLVGQQQQQHQHYQTHVQGASRPPDHPPFGRHHAAQYTVDAPPQSQAQVSGPHTLQQSQPGPSFPSQREIRSGGNVGANGGNYVSQQQQQLQHQPEFRQDFDEGPRSAYEAMPTVGLPPPPCQRGDGHSTGDWSLHQSAAFGYESRGRDVSPTRGARTLDASRDGRGRERSPEHRKDYSRRSDYRGRAHDGAGDRSGRSRSREWRDGREGIRRRSRSRSRGRSRSRDRSRGRPGSYSRGNSSYSPSRNRRPAEPRSLLTTQQPQYGSSAPSTRDWPSYGYAPAAGCVSQPAQPTGPTAAQEVYNQTYPPPPGHEQLPPQAQPQADYYVSGGHASAAFPWSGHETPQPNVLPPVQQQPSMMTSNNGVSEWDPYSRRYAVEGEAPRPARLREDFREVEYRRRDPLPSPDTRDRERARDRQVKRLRDYDRERERERDRERERERERDRKREREREKERTASASNARDGLRRYEKPETVRRDDSRPHDVRRGGSRSNENPRRPQEHPESQSSVEREGAGAAAGDGRRPHPRDRDPRRRPNSPGRQKLLLEPGRKPAGGEGGRSVVVGAAEATATGSGARAAEVERPDQASARVGEDAGKNADISNGVQVSYSGADSGDDLAADGAEWVEAGGGSMGPNSHHRNSPGGTDNDGETTGNGDAAQDGEAFEEEMVDYDLPDELEID